MKKNHRWIAAAVGAAVVIVLAVVLRGRVHFDVRAFFGQVRYVDWRGVALGIGCIYFAYFCRAFRWAILMRPQKHVSSTSLLGTQVIGFTAVALFGRPADPVRPYLVAKRTGTPLSAQFAVYIVERMFDSAAMAAIFSATLFLAPDSRTLPHHELFAKVGKIGLVGSLGIFVLMVAIRLSGEALAVYAEQSLGSLSVKLGHSVAAKIRSFRKGLDTIRSWGEFFAVAGISLGMWGLIISAYIFVMHAFTAVPELSRLSFASSMLLMAASIVSSVVQLPVIGWFTTIAATSETMRGFFDVPREAAYACGALLLIVTFLSVIPAGLLFAHFQRISLRGVKKQSEEAQVVEEELHEEAAHHSS